MTTPLRKQYLGLKGQHPDCVLLFRIGDFYETFGDDAKIMSQVCDVVLTSRSFSSKEQRVPMAGVPYHSVEPCIARLTAAGHTVAVAEQVFNPETGLHDRDITRIVYNPNR